MAAEIQSEAGRQHVPTPKPLKGLLVEIRDGK